MGSNISSTEKDINIGLVKVGTAPYRSPVIRTSDLSDKIKRSFFQAVAEPILLYECATWTQTNHIGKKLNGNSSRMERAILNKS